MSTVIGGLLKNPKRTFLRSSCQLPARYLERPWADFRQMYPRMDKPTAVAAAAHKLARPIDTMLTKGEDYADQGAWRLKSDV